MWSLEWGTVLVADERADALFTGTQDLLGLLKVCLKGTPNGQVSQSHWQVSSPVLGFWGLGYLPAIQL